MTMRHVASSATLLVLAGVVLGAQACKKNSDCDVGAGEWCGSDGGPDECMAGPCRISQSHNHNCYSCDPGLYGQAYTLTEDCFCLTDNLLAGECHDGLGDPAGRDGAGGSGDGDGDEVVGIQTGCSALDTCIADLMGASPDCYALWCPEVCNGILSCDVSTCNQDIQTGIGGFVARGCTDEDGGDADGDDEDDDGGS